jgi:hypothetical protein
VATSEASRFGRYVVSTKNITGVGLATVGPILGLVGIINPLLGLAFAPVLYAVGALAAPSKKAVDLAAGLDGNDVHQSLVAIQHRIQGRVPPEVTQRVQQICTTIDDALPRADALGPGSQGLFVLVHTATDYLPTALQAYLDLPRSYADQHVVADGKTSLALLTDQLDVLTTQMNEVADAVHRSDTDKLVANGRFLAEKFGKGPLDLGNPSGSAA